MKFLHSTVKLITTNFGTNFLHTELEHRKNWAKFSQNNLTRLPASLKLSMTAIKWYLVRGVVLLSQIVGKEELV